MLRFAHTLARDLGMTLSEMGSRMSFREFLSWAAFYKLEAADLKGGSHRARADQLAHDAISAQKGR